MSRLDGRHAVVIGVGSDIGRATARIFAHEGAAVIAVDPSEEAAAEVAAEIGAAGGTAIAQRGAHYSEGDSLELRDACEQASGSLDVVFNCSAVLDYWPESEDSPANWEAVWRANFIGPMIYARSLLPLLQRADSGSLIFLSALDGLFGNPNYPIYSASKGALIPLTHVLAYDAAPHGTRVNCIATGGIDPSDRGSTAHAVRQIEPAKWLPLTPLGRRGTAEEVALVALFLASDDSSYLTGTVIPFDGGRTGLTPGTVFRDPK